MKKILSFSLILVFVCSLSFSKSAQAEIPAKAKAFLTVVGYGAASGALIGMASMAFGNSTRAMAQGASLGLYGGILFGGYVLLSHHQKQFGGYEDSNSPYQDSKDIYGDEYDASEGADGEASPDGGEFFQNNKGGKFPPLYVNLLHLEF